MNLELTDEQMLLKDTLARFFADAHAFEQRESYVRQPDGWSRDFWKQCAELGLLGLPFDSRHGGQEGGGIELMIVMQTIGRVLALEPFMPTVVLGGHILSRAAPAALQDALIPRVVAGELLLALAHEENGDRSFSKFVRTTAARLSGGWRISGSKSLVLGGECADLLIVSARTSGEAGDPQGISLFLVPSDASGVTRHGFAIYDGTRAADILLSNVEVGDEALLGEAGAAWTILSGVTGLAVAMLCAEAVGAMEASLEVTLDYLRTRRQFDAPIGSFQAIQHQAVDMFMALEQARSMSLLAAMVAGEEDTEERTRALSAAKVQIGVSGRFIGQHSIQLHGGIGMTEEHRIGHYFRRLSAINALFGSAEQHLQRLARSGGLMGAWG